MLFMVYMAPITGIGFWLNVGFIINNNSVLSIVMLNIALVLFTCFLLLKMDWTE
jgi:hypothetical protein